MLYVSIWSNSGIPYLCFTVGTSNKGLEIAKMADMEGNFEPLEFFRVGYFIKKQLITIDELS